MHQDDGRAGRALERTVQPPSSRSKPERPRSHSRGDRVGVLSPGRAVARRALRPGEAPCGGAGRVLDRTRVLVRADSGDDLLPAWARLGPLSTYAPITGPVAQTVARGSLRRERSPNGVAWRFPDWSAVGFRCHGRSSPCATSWERSQGRQSGGSTTRLTARHAPIGVPSRTDGRALTRRFRCGVPGPCA